MNRMPGLILLSYAAATSAAVANPLNRPLTPRHQLSACMTKLMTASRTLSYNDAAKICKAQLTANSPALASALPDKPASGLEH